jgi:hypothetical protein
MKKLHTGVRIFFSNPKVVRIKHTIENYSIINTEEFSKLRNKCLKQMSGTWGYTQPEIIRDFNDLNSVNWTVHSYWCFKNEEDLLLFNLITDMKLTKIKLYPSSLLFTIWEMED